MSSTNVPPPQRTVPRHLEDETKQIRVVDGRPYRGRRRPSAWREAFAEAVRIVRGAW